MTTKKAIRKLLFVFCLCACNQSQQQRPDQEEIVLSNDKVALSKIISLETFNPRSVTFLYEPVVKQSKNDLIPGPTDYRLEAVLHFNVTDNINRQGCVPFETSSFSKNDFNFSWLPDTVRSELLNTDSTAKGHIASCFYKGVLVHGSYFYLRNKILLFLYTT